MELKRGEFDISFAWIFAIIIGAFIIFLAIYASTRVIDVGESAVGARTGKEILVLLSPMEIGFETGVSALISMPVESRIENECDSLDGFGTQGLKISQKTLNKWQESNLSTGFPNRYIFSEKITEGKNFFVFAKPFDFPYKVSDLIYLTSTEDNYCFVGANETIKNEISQLGQENLIIGNCTEKSIKVCFSGAGGGRAGSGSNCNITVNTLQKSVIKNQGNAEETMYYQTNALMYAAIFSDKDVYECNVKRLMARGEELALVYERKNSIMSLQGCSENYGFLGLAESFNSVEDSSDLVFIVGNRYDLSGQNGIEAVSSQNRVSDCRMW